MPVSGFPRYTLIVRKGVNRLLTPWLITSAATLFAGDFGRHFSRLGRGLAGR
jgi:hypothetical protein